MPKLCFTRLSVSLPFSVPSTTTDVWVESFTPALAAPPGTVAVGVGVGLLQGASPGAALDAANLRWPENPACPDSAPAPAAARVRPPAAGQRGAALDALFDRVRFGLTGTTPVRLESFSVQ